MLSQAQRTTILELSTQGVSKREIAQVMGHEAASWLERPEREKEENPAKLMSRILDLAPMPNLKPHPC